MYVTNRQNVKDKFWETNTEGNGFFWSMKQGENKIKAPGPSNVVKIHLSCILFGYLTR